MGYKNKEKQKEYKKQWELENPIRVRTEYLVKNYNASDKRFGRGKGDLTAQWLYDNIIFKPCTHCGKTGWDVVGCNRLDNSKPHTKDNVEPCCYECNSNLEGVFIREKLGWVIDKIDMTSGEVLATYPSACEAAIQNNFAKIAILKCCKGGYFDKNRNKWVNCNTYKGSIWKRHLICNT
jgi:hypothetical protein